MTLDLTKPNSSSQPSPPRAQSWNKNKKPIVQRIKLVGFLIAMGIVLRILATSHQTIKTTLYTDNFSSNKNGWRIRNNENVFTQLKNGKYSIQPLALDGSWMVWPDNLNLKKHKNFNIEVTVNKKEDKIRHGYGLYYAGKNTRLFYTFAISHAGYFTIYHYNGNKIVFDVPWKKTTHIRKGSKKNRLKISIQSDKIYYYINDNEVTNLKRHKFYGNKYGFKVDNMQKIYFDDFIIYNETKKSYLMVIYDWIQKNMSNKIIK